MLAFVDYWATLSWLSPIVHFVFFSLAILTFEGAFLCWWRYLAIRGRPDDAESKVGVPVSQLLLAVALLFTIEGCTNLFAPADHILWRPWRWIDYAVFASTILEIAAATWLVRLFTAADCGEKIWILMLLSSLGCGAMVTASYSL